MRGGQIIKEKRLNNNDKIKKIKDMVKNRIGLNWSLLYSKKLSSTEKVIFLIMKDRAYTVDKSCEKGFFCTSNWIVGNTGLNIKTVKTAIKGLKEKELIQIARRTKAYGVTQNEWVINWSVIEKADKQFKFETPDVDNFDKVDIDEEEVKSLNDTTLQQEEESPSEVLETDFRYKELDMSIFDELRETELPIEEKDKQPTASWVDELREIKFNTPAFYKKMNDIIKTYPSAMHDEISSKIYNYFKKAS